MSALRTERPFSLRSRFSSRILSEYGSFLACGMNGFDGREPVDGVRLAADRQGGLAAKAVETFGHREKLTRGKVVVYVGIVDVRGETATGSIR